MVTISLGPYVVTNGWSEAAAAPVDGTQSPVCPRLTRDGRLSGPGSKVTSTEPDPHEWSEQRKNYTFVQLDKDR